MAKPKERLLAPIRPNAGVAALYQKRLDKLVDEMAASINRFVRAAYRANTPVMAQDELPADAMRKAMDTLVKRWTKRFDQGADSLAEYFALKARGATDAALKAALKKTGLVIDFKMTQAQRDILEATTQANVSLIKSIPDQYLSAVQGSVMRSVQMGGDLSTLTEELIKHYGVTRRRAKNIALSQNRLATSALNKARQTELGLDEAEWRHSSAGKEPRPTHVKAGRDRQRYRIADGWYDPAAKRFIQPGELPGCKCTSRSVIPALWPLKQAA